MQTLGVPTFLKPLMAINQWVARLAAQLAAALLAAMVVLILAQVFFRYVMNDSLPWTEELAKFSMVWVVCLVAPWAYRENLNVSIHMFAEALPLRSRQAGDLIITTLILLICALFFRESLSFWQSGLTISAASLPVRLAYFYACTPFMFGFLCLIAVEKLVLQVHWLVTGVDPYAQGDS